MRKELLMLFAALPVLGFGEDFGMCVSFYDTSRACSCISALWPLNCITLWTNYWSV